MRPAEPFGHTRRRWPIASVHRSRPTRTPAWWRSSPAEARGSAGRRRSSSRGPEPRWRSAAADPNRSSRCAASLEGAGAECLAMPTDVRESRAGRAAFLDAVDERFGVVDILVNNAGGQFAAPLESIALKGIRAVHRLNVDATWDVTQRVAERWMIPRRSGFVAFLGFSPRRGVPMMIHSSTAQVGARDVRRGDRAGMVEVRDPRGVHRRRVDPDRGRPAVRRTGRWWTSSRRTSRSAARVSPRRSPRRSRSWPPPGGGYVTGHDRGRGRRRRRVGDGDAAARTRAVGAVRGYRGARHRY